MPNLSQIELPSGSVYDLRDSRVDNLEGFTKYLGKTTTALSDGSTTNPITINGKSVTAVTGDIALYGNGEFIFDGTTWAAFGDLGALGALAYKDGVSVSTVATGNVSAPGISVKTAGATTPITGVTNAGSMPTYTVQGERLIITAGAVPTLATAVQAKTGDAEYEATAPTFTGTPASGTVSYTP